jgi:folylpolyglutamate synthase/dihydrofolate synthase
MGRAIARLNSLINYEKIGAGPKGLESFYNLLESIGNPHKKIKNVIHIVGTKGKGSVSFAISTALINEGYKVGLYTSPHLVSLLERIRLNNKPISEEKLSLYVDIILDKVKDRGFKTFFEVLTASAIMYFLDEKTDFNVFEAGVGGRLDATNVLNQDMVVITRIDYDHMDILGNTLEDITREKSAVIKGKIPVITTKNNRRVLDVILRRVKEFGAQLYVVDWEIVRFDRYGIEVEVEGERLSAPVLGEFQGENLALAYKALKLLGIEKPKFFNLSIPGRLQVISKDPYIIVDGAHNTISIKKLLESLKALFPEKRFKVVLAISSDKNVKEIVWELSRTNYELYITRYPFPRSVWVEDMFKYSYIFGKPPKILNSTSEILSLLNEGDVVITGSFYLVGEVLKLLGF